VIDERGTMQAHRWCSACRGVIEPGATHVRRDGLFRHETCAEEHHGRWVGREGSSTSTQTPAQARVAPSGAVRSARVVRIEDVGQLTLLGVG
jgi:hypothetical protein